MHRLGGRNEVTHLISLRITKDAYLVDVVLVGDLGDLGDIVGVSDVAADADGLVAGRVGTHGGDEDVSGVALPPLFLHLSEPEGQPQGAHPEQARQPRGEPRLYVLWQTPQLEEQSAGPHIPGKKHCQVEVQKEYF